VPYILKPRDNWAPYFNQVNWGGGRDQLLWGAIWKSEKTTGNTVGQEGGRASPFLLLRRKEKATTKPGWKKVKAES